MHVPEQSSNSRLPRGQVKLTLPSGSLPNGIIPVYKCVGIVFIHLLGLTELSQHC